MKGSQGGGPPSPVSRSVWGLKETGRKISRQGNSVRVRNNHHLGDNSDEDVQDLQVIPDLDEDVDEDVTKQVAAPPVVQERRLKGRTEPASKIPVSVEPGIDLTLLTTDIVLDPSEPDKLWEYDAIFQEVKSILEKTDKEP
eukprot:GHVQ01018923.1.p3 GENE.GHVQ01018923.1~~GHVQ01018923.1.p3  ORF type:complete len:141 (+),score=23.47 GHVQ01018923.1:305-727(+)